MKDVLRYFFLVSVFTCHLGESETHAQVQSLHPEVLVNHYSDVVGASSSIAYDELDQSIYYSNVSGDIRRVDPTMPGTSTLEFTTADHGIPNVHGVLFHDSVLFVIGNDWTDGTQAIGIISKGTLQTNGTRLWLNVLQSVAYPATNATFDHGFSGLCVDPTEQYLFFNSGSRSDHGEIQTAGGIYPGLREVPITSAIFRIPIGTVNLALPNDLALLQAGAWLYADGTRNTFSMAFNANGDLFGAENSGDRDDPEELNRIEFGKHYGFPWNMGGNQTPQQFPAYDPDADKLVNPNCKAYSLGFFYDDPSYPPAPTGGFEAALMNTGPDANYLRDNVTGAVVQATSPMGSFSMHRSPLGLVFDTDSLLATDFRGDGYLLSFTQGGGDSAGFIPNSIWGLPVVPVDPSQDLLHLNFSYDPVADQYSFGAHRIVEGFNIPIASVLVDSVLYVLEYGTASDRNIWRIELPTIYTGIQEHAGHGTSIQAFPNPFDRSSRLVLDTRLKQDEYLELLDLNGRVLRRMKGTGASEYTLEKGSLAAGAYLLRVVDKNRRESAHVRLIVH